MLLCWCFGCVVIKLLVYGECLGQSCFGVVYCLGKWCGLLFVEFFDGQCEFVGVGVYGVVDVYYY